MGVAFVYLCCDNNQIVKSNRKSYQTGSGQKVEPKVNGQEVMINH